MCISQGIFIATIYLKRTAWSETLRSHSVASIVDFPRLSLLGYVLHAMAFDNLWTFARECEQFSLARTVIYPIHNEIVVRFVSDSEFQKQCEFSISVQFKLSSKDFMMKSFIELK